MNNKIKNVIFIAIFFLILWGFYYVNDKNYLKLKEAKSVIVSHPELLPKKEFAKYTSFWYSNLRADIYWLEAVQYIWSNAISSEYKKYLYKVLDLITELNPYFEKPYSIWQLLLPNYNERYESLTKEEIEQLNTQARKIWEKWIKNFCDETKIKKIIETNDLQKIWTDKSLQNPCKSQDIPFSQAFLEYYYLKDTKSSANYYKIASAQSDALPWSRVMAAIMNWKSWNREISIMMFLSIAAKEKQTEKCTAFSQELQNLSYAVFHENVKLDEKTIKEIEKLRNQYFVFDKEAEKKALENEKCDNYINKAVREFNLYYIDQANKQYFKDNKQNAIDAKELFDKWYIKFLPTDFQQYWDYWIIYKYNNDLKTFDYEMWNY